MKRLICFFLGHRFTEGPWPAIRDRDIPDGPVVAMSSDIPASWLAKADWHQWCGRCFRHVHVAPPPPHARGKQWQGTPPKGNVA